MAKTGWRGEGNTHHLNAAVEADNEGGRLAKRKKMAGAVVSWKDAEMGSKDGLANRHSESAWNHSRVELGDIG